MSAFHILIIGDIHSEGKKLLQKKADIKVTTNFEKKYILQEVKDVDAIIIRGMEATLDKEIILNAPKLRVIGRHGIGLETIGLEAARRSNVQVVYFIPLWQVVNQ